MTRRGDDPLPEIYLRESAHLPALRRQLAAIARGPLPGPLEPLQSHLGRAERRLGALRSLLGTRGGAPPAPVEAAFRLFGAAVGWLTSRGGGRRTMRAVSDGARGLANLYAKRLSGRLDGETERLLATNYRDLLLLVRWSAERLGGRGCPAAGGPGTPGPPAGGLSASGPTVEGNPSRREAGR